jgi:uncharacterized C2H2 Zn-finger protein
MMRLICKWFGHAKPDGRVTSFYDSRDGIHTWQCPRCRQLAQSAFEPARGMNRSE